MSPQELEEKRGAEENMQPKALNKLNVPELWLKAAELGIKDKMEVDLEGKKISDVVNAWLDANKTTWEPWTQCN